MPLAFTTAPLLHNPDPEKAVCHGGVFGVVMFQRCGERPKLPIAYFSRKLSPMERNSDIGNELLAIMLALEEWSHWLGVPHFRFSFILTIKIWSTFRHLSDLIHARPGGCFPLPTSHHLPPFTIAY